MRRFFRRLRVAWVFRVWPWCVPREAFVLSFAPLTAKDIARTNELARLHKWEAE